MGLLIVLELLSSTSDEDRCLPADKCGITELFVLKDKRNTALVSSIVSPGVCKCRKSLIV